MLIIVIGTNYAARKSLTQLKKRHLSTQMSSMLGYNFIINLNNILKSQRITSPLMARKLTTCWLIPRQLVTVFNMLTGIQC